MPVLKARILDSENLRPVAAKLNLTGKDGSTIFPPGNILKVGYGSPFFYADGSFEVNVPSGPLEVTVERGIEYTPLTEMLDVPSSGILKVDLKIGRWINLAQLGWYSGNTHVHYRETETRPDDRLRLDPQVEDLKVLIISILHRWGISYSSNKYPVGHSHDFLGENYVTDVGEECRHNMEDWNPGYGHVLFANIKRLVEPVSRGLLVNRDDPDYPPLCDACDEAHAQGGVVIWCHDGVGMESAVAIALGKVDALNLFDPVPSVGYDYWYRLLNCGFKLPASSGTDWFICDSNRVYVFIGARFSYNAWLEGLKMGRTFVTNTPALFLSADGRMPGDTIELRGGSTLDLEVEARSCIPMNCVEIVKNGEVVHREELNKGTREARFLAPIRIDESCWIAARCSGTSQTSSGHPIFGHTSPIYVEINQKRICRKEDAKFFADHIDKAMGWINERGKFRDKWQKQHLISLFNRARSVYEDLVQS